MARVQEGVTMAPVTDIRLNIALTRHWKYRKFKRLIGRDALERLVSFWIQVALQSPSGDISAWSTSDVEDAAEWRGKRGNFLAALLEVGLLDRTSGGLFVHDWAEHQHWIVGAPKRSTAARNAIEARWERERRERELREQDDGNDTERIRGVDTDPIRCTANEAYDSGKGEARAFQGRGNSLTTTSEVRREGGLK
jgi:hypothetical protein